VNIAVIIATFNREYLLLDRAINAVAKQTLSPKQLVIINDGAALSEEIQHSIIKALGGIPVIIIGNQRTQGYAGALNTGLSELRRNSFDGYVALLDDDDTWDSIHLDTNLAKAVETQADVVVSGLRLIKDQVEKQRALPRDLNIEDFLVGNPGWQGSNTFVRLHTLIEAGGFREGLVSCNDRDLAIRVLGLPRVRIAYTGQWTASWHLEHTRFALSHGGSESKRSGLRAFWHLHRSDMSLATEALFFSHALSRFGISPEDIKAPLHPAPRFQLFT
jgi:glycosyltransferase involved in cell wall biosynthesis